MKYASVRIYVFAVFYPLLGSYFCFDLISDISLVKSGFRGDLCLFLPILTILRSHFALPRHSRKILMDFFEFQFYDFCLVILSNFVSLSRHFLSRCLVVSSYFVSLSRPFLSRCLVVSSFFVSLSRCLDLFCLVVSLSRSLDTLHFFIYIFFIVKFGTREMARFSDVVA